MQTEEQVRQLLAGIQRDRITNSNQTHLGQYGIFMTIQEHRETQLKNVALAVRMILEELPREELDQLLAEQSDAIG